MERLPAKMIALLESVGFSIGEPLGGGTYCQVFHAQNSEGQVVIKVTRQFDNPGEQKTLGQHNAKALSFHTGHVGSLDPDPNEIITKEGEVLKHIKHPSMVKLIEARHFEGFDFIVMEYIEGLTWREALLTDCPPTIKSVLDLVAALLAMQKSGELKYHGDIKPDNLILGEGEKLRIIDPSSGFTKHGRYGGTLRMLLTPFYNPFCSQSDIPALGLLIIEVSTGKHPLAFSHKEKPQRNIGQELRQVLKMALATGQLSILQRVPHMLLPKEIRKDFPIALEKIALRCLGLKRTKDELDWCNPYEDLSELLDDLEGFTDLSPPIFRLTE
jgi:serine/threonine protein kinase